jgi:glycosyltransferase involved in cell wall biosynthesis
VDDSIWLMRGGAFAASIARLCHTVICGNSVIAEFFRRHAANVTVLPTPVDTDRYRPTTVLRQHTSHVICWSGTSSGYRFLYGIENGLAAALRSDRRRILRVICDRPPKFRALPSEQVEFVQWSPAVEVSSMRDAGVALMPLDDSEWSHGKCSYKMLTYMSCGIPVVATPVGMNAEVLAQGDIGFQARSETEWADAIDVLLRDRERARAMGDTGRQVALRKYSLTVLAPRLAAILRAAQSGSN